MIYRQKFFDQPVRNNLITYDNKQKILTRQEIITQLVVCWNIIISKYIIK